MASVVKVKKNRFDIVLKNRNITLQELADKTGYLRQSISRAINNRKMNEAMLDNISKYLDVSPYFFTGEERLRRVKPGRIEEFKERIGERIDPTGYVIPSYVDHFLTKSIKKWSETPIYQQFPEYRYLQQAYLVLGERGVFDGESMKHFDKQFVESYFNYLITEAYSFMREQVVSVLVNDQRYQEYCHDEELNVRSEEEDAEYYESFFDFVQEDSDE